MTKQNALKLSRALFEKGMLRLRQDDKIQADYIEQYLTGVAEEILGFMHDEEDEIVKNIVQPPREVKGSAIF